MLLQKNSKNVHFLYKNNESNKILALLAYLLGEFGGWSSERLLNDVFRSALIYSLMPSENSRKFFFKFNTKIMKLELCHCLGSAKMHATRKKTVLTSIWYANFFI